jgi:outer membrane protein assembly factor BamA
MRKVFGRWSVFVSIGIMTICDPLFGQQKQDSPSLKQLERTDIIDFAGLLFAKKGKAPGRDDPHGKTHFSVIPIAPASSGKGVSISAINASFYADPESNLSTVYFYPYTNFTTAYGLFLSPYIWLNKNEWNVTGDFRIVYNGLRDYGIGGSVPPSDYTVIKHSQWRSFLTAHTRIFENFYLGVGYNLDYFWGVVEEDPTPETPSDFQQYGIGIGNTTVSSGITFNILRDNRKNAVNPKNGMYSTLILKVNRKAMGSTTEWGSVFLDVRRYLSFSDRRHKILAGRAFYWGTYGDVPYFNLPATFEDPSWRAGRGYLTNRFRGQHWLFAETEYRFDISSRGFFGAVLFANVQSYSDPGGSFANALGAAGFGFRFKFNRHSDTNLTLDFAYGKEGWNWYINLGEYF